MGRSLSQKAKFITERLGELKIQLPPGSRFWQMDRLFNDKDGNPRGVIMPDDPDFEKAVEALRDLPVFEFALQNVFLPVSDECRRILQKVVQDSILPQEDKEKSTGRDFQTELFVAAICRNAGFKDIRHEEPDIQCVMNSRNYSLAVKRLKSVSKLQKNVQKAASQVEKSKTPGFVVLDTNFMLNPSNERIWAQMPDEEFIQRYKSGLHQFIRKHHGQLQKWVQEKGVRGIIIHDQQIRLVPDMGWCLEGLTVNVNTAGQNQRPNREFRMFTSKYETGLPNRM